MSKFNFIKNERKLLKWWYESGLVDKYLHKNKNSKKRFSFMDGPITANNPMGVHHAWGRTLKDLYQRYKNMQGFKQRFQNGFDCQGLWIEVEVEKEKKFKSKKDIEKYGIAKFVQDCKNRVKKYSGIQTKQSKRLGYFMDWDNSYYTMSDENNYMIWHFLKKVWQDGCLYKGNDAVPWCPRCGTSISQHEMENEGYKKITHESVYMQFPVIKKNNKLIKNEFLLVWTTTPWTIPADTIVAVSPDIQYALVKSDNKKYWLAEKLIKQVFDKNLKPIKTISGEDLINKEKITRYQAPFDNLPIIKKIAEQAPEHFHAVVLSKDLVNDDEGTGLVHIVPGAGTEDHHLVKFELGWQNIIFPVIDESAAYVDGYDFLTGKNAKDDPGLIINYLKNEKPNFLFKTKQYTHSYPTCWRCKTELVWRLVDEWYIKMDGEKVNYRKNMKKVTKKINWQPEFGLKRELDWLNNMRDWMISKKRYYGLALPIWECECGHFEVIGSREELKEKASKAGPPGRRGWKEFDGHTPHRPYIDKIKIKCPKCKKLMTRVTDVGNPWLDAGIVNFSTLIDPKTKKISYLDNKKYWQKWFPANFVTECFPGQFRNWFYALIAMSTVLENHEPFENLLGHALVRDEKGEEMHKSKGNAIWFDDAAEKMGVDSMRWLYTRQDPEHNLNFGYNIADQVRRQHIFLLWNSYKFFETYAKLNKFDLSANPPQAMHVGRQALLDSWIISRTETTKKQVTQNLDRFHHEEAIKQIENLLDDLSTWYIRQSRTRVRPDNLNKKDINNCLNTLHYVLKNLCLLLAPVIPYLTETIWQGLHGKSDNLDVENSVHLQPWPKTNEKLIMKSEEDKMQAVREIVSLGHAIRKNKQIGLRQPLAKFIIYNFQFSKLSQELIGLIKQELNIKQVKFGKDKGELKVELDTKLTPKLEAEGQANNLMRDVQKLRREAGLKLDDKIVIYAPEWSKNFEATILKRTNATKIKKGKELQVKKC